MTIVPAVVPGKFVSKMAFQSPFQRFLSYFAYSSNTLEEDSQEYEDVESSQSYIPDSDKTEIVDNDNETVSRCEILPRLCQTLSASCTRRLDCFVRTYVMLSWKHMIAVHENSIFKREKKQRWRARVIDNRCKMNAAFQRKIDNVCFKCKRQEMMM